MQADLLLQRKVGFHFWSALPPAPARAAKSSLVAGEGRLPGSCLVLPALLPTGPEQHRQNGLETGSFHSVIQKNYKEWLIAAIEKWSSKRQPITTAPLPAVRGTHMSSQVSLVWHNRIQICPEQPYHNSGILWIKPGSGDLQRFISLCSKRTS